MNMAYLTKLLIPVILSAVLGYLCGSVSFSILFTRWFKQDDIRNYGSGNAGATNVLRSVGKLPAALTFVFDFIKCVISVVLGYLILQWVCRSIGVPEDLSVIGKYAGGLGCLFGHIFPLYFGFRGGKGVVTTAALIALLDVRVFIPCILTFAIIFAAKRIVSLSSVVAACCYPVYTFIIVFFFDYAKSPLSVHGAERMGTVMAQTLAAVLIAVIVLITHRANLKRLLRGEEKPLTLH